MALDHVFKLYSVREKLINAVHSFYEDASACVKKTGETCDPLEIKVGLRQGCVISLICSIYMDGVKRETKGRVEEVTVKMYAEGRTWVLNSILLAADTVLIAKK